MQLQIGTVVCAVAGKEKDNFYLIVRTDGHFIYLADGRHRTMEKPKRKNPKHVRPTKFLWNPVGMTDKMLRHKLYLLKGGNEVV